MLWRRGERGFVGLVAVAVVGLPLVLVLSRSGQGFSDHFTSRHLIFVLPLWAALVGAGFAAVTREFPGRPRAALLVALTAAALLAPSVVPDPRSLRSGTRDALAAPAGWLRDEIEPNAILFPNSPVFLAALPAARHAEALAARAASPRHAGAPSGDLPAPALYVAVPLDGDERARGRPGSALGAGFGIQVFPLVAADPGSRPVRQRPRVLEQLVRAVSAVRASIDSPLSSSRAICGRAWARCAARFGRREGSAR